MTIGGVWIGTWRDLTDERLVFEIQTKARSFRAWWFLGWRVYAYRAYGGLFIGIGPIRSSVMKVVRP